jgi:mono/diheme cytochrome c family protein
MRGTAATGWGLLIGGLVLAVLIGFGLYRWDAGARAAEASLRPQPVAPLAAAASPVPQPAAVGALGASPQAVAASGSGDPAAGQTVFQAKCNACHPNAAAGIGPALYGQAFTDRNPDSAAIMAVVRAGRGGMPAFGPAGLTDPDLTNIVAYLRSLSAASAAAPVLGVAANPSAVAVPQPAAAVPIGSPSAAVAAVPTPLSQDTLSGITPGLSSYMLEAAKRMGRAWFAAQANNWDESAFEIREARGVLQAGAARSNPSRQQGLQAFNDGFMSPLVDAAQSGDQTQYEQAYTSAIQGCNACHAAQTYGAINQPFSFIRVQVPKTSIWDVYAYAK